MTEVGSAIRVRPLTKRDVGMFRTWLNELHFARSIDHISSAQMTSKPSTGRGSMEVYRAIA
ncbi:MAG: hypothetical protein AAGC81_12795 [Pseudomonadota bacterium]